MTKTAKTGRAGSGKANGKAGTIKVQATCKTGPYKGYFGRAVWDADAEFFHGDVIGTRDVITFQGKTIDELNKEFVESIEDYLDLCKKSGRPPERPFSGNFVVRIPAELHKLAWGLAEQRGISLNALVVELIEEATGKKPARPARRKQA
jgi:predicted HicB family RNase H-like nuclease